MQCDGINFTNRTTSRGYYQLLPSSKPIRDPLELPAYPAAALVHCNVLELHLVHFEVASLNHLYCVIVYSFDMLIGLVHVCCSVLKLHGCHTQIQ
jgi:hypothetical protein